MSSIGEVFALVGAVEKVFWSDDAEPTVDAFEGLLRWMACGRRRCANMLVGDVGVLCEGGVYGRSNREDPMGLTERSRGMIGSAQAKDASAEVFQYEWIRACQGNESCSS